jgi:alcohol dehydrogenase (cytochrome c)
LFLTTLETTIAIDASSCRELWRVERKPWRVPEWPNNRGAAIKDGLLVRGTADGYLVALDATTGAIKWQRRIARPDEGEMLNMPPLIYEDRVIIGPAGSERLVRGWVGAFRLLDGKPLWRFETFPRDDTPEASTWHVADTADVGGATLWTPVTLDPRTGTLYVSTSNPAPDHIGDVRLGANLFANSVVALDVKTGARRWYRQMVQHDTHDWDRTHAGPLFEIDGRRLMATAGKDGLLHVLERDNGAGVAVTTVSTRKNVDAPITLAGTYACPGKYGGVEWNGPAFSPQTRLLYVPSVELCGTFTRFARVRRRFQREPGRGHDGGWFAWDTATRAGYVTAVEPLTGAIKWRYRSNLPVVGAVTVTAGGLVFAGELGGDLLALDAASGAVLLRTPTGGAVGGGIVAYALGDREYIAVASGAPTVTIPVATVGGARLTVFGLRK